MGRGWGECGLLVEGGGVGCCCELGMLGDEWVGVGVGVGYWLRVEVLGVVVSWECGGMGG